MLRRRAALADSIGSAPLTLHDPRDADALIFRRPPSQKRGGIFLNAHWMQAAIPLSSVIPAQAGIQARRSSESLPPSWGEI